MRWVLAVALLAHVAPSPLLFYIYEWPAPVVDSWPTDFTFTKRLSFESHFEANHAVGRPVNDGKQSKGFYHTHQYSLFRTFLGRLRESALRTRDPAQASLFFVPYDVGMDGEVTAHGFSLDEHYPQGISLHDFIAHTQEMLQLHIRDEQHMDEL